MFNEKQTFPSKCLRHHHFDTHGVVCTCTLYAFLFLKIFYSFVCEIQRKKETKIIYSKFKMMIVRKFVEFYSLKEGGKDIHSKMSNCRVETILFLRQTIQRLINFEKKFLA